MCIYTLFSFRSITNFCLPEVVFLACSKKTVEANTIFCILNITESLCDSCLNNYRSIKWVRSYTYTTVSEDTAKRAVVPYSRIVGQVTLKYCDTHYIMS